MTIGPAKMMLQHETGRTRQHSNCTNNKSAQSNLGTGPHRCECLPRGGLRPACVAEAQSGPCAMGSAPWRSFMNMHVTPATLLRAFVLSSSNRYFLLISHKPQHWSWNRIYPQKGNESSFPTICSPNGNVVKFLHTNRKHFTIVGDPCLLYTSDAADE